MDFDEAAGVEGVESRLVAEQVAVVAFGVAVAFLIVFLHNVEDGGFAFIVDDVVGDAALDQFFLAVVDHAAGDYQQGLGVFPSDLMDGLAAFLIALVGDGTGVHHEDVGFVVAAHHLIAACLEPRRQRIGLKEVHSATQGFESNFFHNTRLLILCKDRFFY